MHAHTHTPGLWIHFILSLLKLDPSVISPFPYCQNSSPLSVRLLFLSINLLISSSKRNSPCLCPWFKLPEAASHQTYSYPTLRRQWPLVATETRHFSIFIILYYFFLKTPLFLDSVLLMSLFLSLILIHFFYQLFFIHSSVFIECLLCTRHCRFRDKNVL